jgi:hypothetical protein
MLKCQIYWKTHIINLYKSVIIWAVYFGIFCKWYYELSK